MEKFKALYKGMYDDLKDAEMMIDYSVYRNRECSKIENKKAYFIYNKLIIDCRWNHIKNKLFNALNKNQSLLL